MQGGSTRRVLTAARAFNAGWKIHCTNVQCVYGGSCSQVSGNDVMHAEMYMFVRN